MLYFAVVKIWKLYFVTVHNFAAILYSILHTKIIIPNCRQLGELAVDVSLAVWGATFLPSKDQTLFLGRGFFNRASLHINVRDMEVVRKGSLSFFPTPRRRPPSLSRTGWA